MANPIAGISSTQQSQQPAQVSQSTPKTQTTKDAAGGSVQADTVNISSAGRAASQAQPPAQSQQSASDSDHDGH